MASNFWGVPRTTHDLDFVIQLDSSSVTTIVNAFEGDYFVQEPMVRAALAKPPRQFNVIDQRSALKVDFWLLSGEPFEQCMFARRVSKSLFGVAAWIATAEDVMLHKLYRNRLTPSERQMADAAGVFAVQQAALDLEYMRGWAKKLMVADTLEQVLAGAVQPKAT